MRVLFVYADAFMHSRMGIMYLASSLKAKGHEVRFADARQVGLKGLQSLVDAWKPGIVGYTAMTGEHVALLELSRKLKEDYDHLAVFGGTHATFCPEELVNDTGCDAACVGEGDVAFPEFVQRLESGTEWWQTPNFVVKRDDEIVRNRLLPLVEDLSVLPMPDHDLMYETDSRLAQDGTKAFYSSRDCPCTCTYCFQHTYRKLYRGKGFGIRSRAPEKLVDEMVYVKERYPLTNVMIMDDSLLVNPPEWFDRFCPDYKKRVGLPFSACLRASLVTEERIAQLSDAGMTVAAMGIECGNDAVGTEVLKRNQSKEQIRRAVSIIKRHNIFLMSMNICGFPVPDSYKVDLETLDFNVELAPDWAWSSLLYPYPGTEIREYALARGALPEDNVPVLVSNKRFSVFSFSSPLEKRRIENLHKLFDIFTHHPWLRRHADFLCSLPLGPLYFFIWYIQYGYVWKFKMFPFTSPVRELWRYVALMLKMIRQ
jgi:radical SAM superfamily enzyme YgiQ (UPF0313 family)